MRDIAWRYGVQLHDVPMVGDTLRDLQAAQAAGCPPHLVRCGRAQALGPAELADIQAQVPEARVHDSLDAFVDHLLAQEDLPRSGPAPLGAHAGRR
jgi:D-glycero-D-manno-heptose 1,7-bisphosphate phosphatase